jgi:hypothetical protein
MGKLGVSAGVGLLLTLAACTGGPPTPATSARSSIPSPTASSASDVSCADSIDQAAVLPEDYRVVAGMVGLPTQRVLQASPSGEHDPVSKLFAKWGLVVRAGATVEIAVGPGWEQKARIGWGKPGPRAASIRVTACPATGGSSAWTAFAGGTWVTTPACVPLTIRANGRAETTRLPVGKPCA